MTLALVATVTAVIAQVLIKWIVSGWGLQWHEVAKSGSPRRLSGSAL